MRNPGVSPDSGPCGCEVEDRLDALGAELRRRLAERAAQRAASREAGPPPRYDEVYWQGVAWLDGRDDWRCQACGEWQTGDGGCRRCGREG